MPIFGRKKVVPVPEALLESSDVVNASPPVGKTVKLSQRTSNDKPAPQPSVKQVVQQQETVVPTLPLRIQEAVDYFNDTSNMVFSPDQFTTLTSSETVNANLLFAIWVEMRELNKLLVRMSEEE